MIERGVTWLVAGNNRRLRCIGVVKNHARIRACIAGLSLKQLLSLGLTAKNGGWALTR